MPDGHAWRRLIPALAAALWLGGCATAPKPAPGPAETPLPTPTATPTPPPAVPPLAPAAASHTDEPLLRVLLGRPAEPVELPQPGRLYRATWTGAAAWLWGPLRLVSQAETWWQVAAFSDGAGAAAAADRLVAALGKAVEVSTDRAADGLIRVRLRWRGTEPEDPVAALGGIGFSGAFKASDGSRIRILSAGFAPLDTEGEVVLEPQGDWPTALGERRYWGRFRVRASGEELLVINQLNMESYLRGVVPLEMGPAQFPELEALKAQAVAARTYAVAHLGDHDDEGYDICDSAACQVYGGAAVSHRLSDRAVAETAGLIAAYEGRPIDAMYTSTCGGHTEDAALLFPDRAQPYLVGVVCAWERPLRLEGTDEAGPQLDRIGHSAIVARQVLGVAPTASPGELVRAVYEHSGVAAHLLAALDVESFAIALLTAAGIEAPPSMVRVSTGLETLLVLSDLYGLELPPPPDGLKGDWPAAAALAVLELRGELVRDRGEAVPHPDGVAIYPRRAAASEPLPSPLPLWERWAGGYRRVADAELLPGTELERLRFGDRVVALVVSRSGGADEADRRSAWRSWVREREWEELARRLEMPDFERLTVTRRGVSGRVVEMAAHGSSGSHRLLEGFPIRRSLDLPENLFSMHVLSKPDGRRVVRFLGRGWGHGVGLCQNGSYGLARAGRSFDQILGHYYGGIEILRWLEGMGTPEALSMSDGG